MLYMKNEPDHMCDIKVLYCCVCVCLSQSTQMLWPTPSSTSVSYTRGRDSWLFSLRTTVRWDTSVWWMRTTQITDELLLRCQNVCVCVSEKNKTFPHTPLVCSFQISERAVNTLHVSVAFVPARPRPAQRRREQGVWSPCVPRPQLPPQPMGRSPRHPISSTR